MNDHFNLNELIELVKQQEPNRKDLIQALENCVGGKWTDKAYFQFVDSTNANQIGAEWQFEENIIIEHPTRGTLVIDFLKNRRIGGIEFLKL